MPDAIDASMAFSRGDAGRTFERFERLKSWLASRNERLRFAMNAGMFRPDLSPVGLLVQDGQQVSPLNLSDDTGNFFLKPNGVFSISESGPRIVESTEYQALAQGASCDPIGPFACPQWFPSSGDQCGVNFTVVFSLYSTDLQRNDSRGDLGPIIGVVR